MKIALFSEDLRECLNAAGFSDCGENDAWNYWYQRLMKSHNECADRGILTEQAENAKLRKLVARVERARRDLCDAYPDAELLSCEECPAWSECKGDLMDRMRELGVEVD